MFKDITRSARKKNQPVKTDRGGAKKARDLGGLVPRFYTVTSSSREKMSEGWLGKTNLKTMTGE